MAFLAPVLGSLASSLFGKIFHFEKGGVVHIKGQNKHKGTLAVLHDGEMVVPKKHVARTRKAMHENHIAVPRPKKVEGLKPRKPRARKVPHK